MRAIRLDNSVLLDMCFTGLANVSKCLAYGFLSWCACKLIRRCEPHSERSQAGCMHACLHVFLRAFSCCSTACLSYWDGVGTLITDMLNNQVAVS